MVLSKMPNGWRASGWCGLKFFTVTRPNAKEAREVLVAKLQEQIKKKRAEQKYGWLEKLAGDLIS